MTHRLPFRRGRQLVHTLSLLFLLLLNLPQLGQTQSLQPAGPNATICDNDTIRVIGFAPGSTFQWTRNNANIPGATNSFLVVTQNGNYGCIVTSAGSPTTLGPVNVTIQTPPAVLINPANPSLCPGGSVSISASGASTYSWSPATGLNTTTGATVVANPSTTTNYSVVATQGACEVIRNITVTVRPQPIASFNWGPQPPACLNRRRSIRFTSTSQANGSGALSYSWNFGDPNSGSNNTSTQANPQHSFVGAGFANSGTFNVTLTVTGANGCSSTSTQTITVQSFPDATLSADAQSTVFNGQDFWVACGNDPSSTITFFNNSSTLPTNTQYFIDWGDGSPTLTQSTITSPLPHTYGIGTFQLTHIVSNGTCRDTSVYNIFVGSNPAVGLGNPGNTSICTGSSLTFPITNTENNPPGTIYTVTFNDNTPPITFSHPPPASVTHTFNTNSCGVLSTSGNVSYNNSFSATIVAANPCQSSASAVVPIYVSERPEADFLVVPGDTVCANRTVTIRNNSIEGNQTGPNQALGVCGGPRRVWRITPATGWTLVSGVLGNDNNNNNPNTWQSGTDSIRVNFTTPGQYTIRFAVGSGTLCGIDTITRVICVNPEPTADFALTKTTLCVNDSVTATGITNTPLCGTNSFNWTVDFLPIPGCNPTTSSYTLLGGTTLQSPSLQIQYNNPGIYIIRLQTIAPLGACVSPIVEKRDTVKTRPNVRLTLPQAGICVGESITPQLVDSCFVTNATYQWTITGGTTTSSLTSSTPPIITYANPGSYTITVAVTNECGTTTVSQNITVTPTPVITPTADRTDCAGTNIPVMALTTNPTGATISWTNSAPGIGLPASGNGDIPAFVAQNNGNTPLVATIIVRASLNGCNAIPDTFLITVLPTPQVNAVPNQVVCVGGSTNAINFTGSAIAGTVYNWTNSNPAIGLAASGTGNIPAFVTTNTTNAPINATITVTPVVSGGGSNCPGVPTSFTITVNPVPAADPVTDQTLCNGASSNAITLSGNTPGAVYTWSTTGTIGLIPASGTNTIPAFTAVNNGTTPITAPFTVTPSFTSGGLTCTGSVVNFNIVVNPAPVVSFSVQAQTICSGSSTAAVTLTSNLANTSISWTANIPAGITGATASGTDQIPAETLTNNTNAPLTITYTVNATTSGGSSCPGTAQTYTITVNPIPNATANPANAILCSGATFTSALSSNVNGTTFTWTVNAPANITGESNGTGTTINQTLSNTGTNTENVVYTITPTFTNNTVGCPGAPIDIPVTVHPTPVVTVNPRFEQICSSAATSGVTPNTPVANTTINWTATAALGNLTGFTATGTGNIPSFTLVNTGNTIDTLIVTLTPSANNCTGDTVQYRVLVIPEARINNTPLQEVICSGSASTAVNWTSNVAGASFSWTAVASSPNVTGFVSSGSGNLPSFTLTNTGTTTETVTITVTPSRGGCPGMPTDYILRVNPRPTVDAVANQTVCTNTNTAAVNFSSPVAGTQFAWSTPATIGLTPNSGTGNIPSFTADNPGNTPITALFTVTPTVTLNGLTCSGPNSTFSITVNPSPTVLFNQPDQTICSGGTSSAVSLSSNTPGATIAWTANIPTSIMGAITNGTTSIPTQTLINTGNTPATIIITATATTGGGTACAGVDAIYRITVNPIPDVVATPNAPEICSGTSPQINLSSAVNGTVFTWTVTAPASVSGASNGTGNLIDQVLTNTSTQPQTVVYRITPQFTNNGVTCTGTPINVSVIVNPLPVINNNPLTQAFCTGGTSQAVAFTSATANAQFAWTLANNTGVTGAVNSGTTVLPAMTLTNAGLAPATLTYAVTTTAAGCPGSPVNYTITVWPNARALFTFAADTGCAPFALSIQNQGPSTANGSYQWLANNTVIGTSEAFPGYTINNSDDSIRITLIALSPNGCRPDTMRRMFYTLPIPVPSFTRTPIDTCGPVTVQFTNTTPRQPEFQFLWDFGNGQTSTNAIPPTITYLPNPGFRDTTYFIRLFAFNRCDTIIALDSVIVRTKPRARFGVQSTTGCSPFTVQIANTSLGTGNVYYWDFGDGNRDTTFTLANVQHTYFVAQTDTFDIRLIAVNQCGSDTLIIPIRVAPNTIRPILNVAAPGLIGCAPHTVTFLNNSIGATQYSWNFGDGSPIQQTTDTLTAITHTFTNSGTYTVVVRLSNGCTDSTAQFTITVFGQPNAAFTATTPVCVGDTVRVQNSSTQASSFRWFWGDGNQSVGNAPTHVYNSPGTYTIILRAEQTAAAGIVCSDTVQRNVLVLAKPDLTLQSNLTTVTCTPFTFQGSLPNITNETVQWIVNDTSRTPAITTITGSSANYTFQNPGTYRIIIRASNTIGCSDSTILTVVVRGRPRALIAPSAITTCSTDTTIVFTNNSQSTDGFALSYTWQVNGNTVGTNASFSNRFVLPNAVPMPYTFTTRLIARNNVGCTDTAVSTLQMVPTSDASFAIQNPNDCVPFALSIQQGSQYADRYRWLVNGVQVDTARIPNIILTAPATTYRIELITSNAFGCRPDTAVSIITTRQRPRAAFTLRDTLGCTGNLNVITTNTSQFANTYSWSWGDGTPGTNFVNPTHLYNTVGQYQITLVASDGVCRDTTTRVVRVSNKPVVNFTVDVPVSCDTARVQLTNLTTNADTYLWTFSNGFQSTLMNPQYSFPPSASLYTIKLVASNAAGCRDSLTRSNLVQAIIPPVAGFTVLPSPVISIPNYTFNFQSTSLDRNTYRYQWDLGDGANATTRNVTHLYPDTGTYRVQQILLDTQTGCADTVSRLVTIQGQPGYLYVPNAFYPNSIQDQFRYFRPLGKGLATYHFQVFDSWGKLLFESKALDAAGSPTEGWDGTFKGQPMPQDGYAWRIQAVFRNGRKWEGMSYNNNQSGAPAHTFGTVTLFR